MRTDRDILGGEHAVYPGHPVTLALCIVHNFPNWEAATKECRSGYPSAVSDNSIPGAGGNVYSALDFLNLLRKGTPFEQAVEMADDTWGRCDNHKATNAPRWTTGQEQANRFKDKLKEMSAWWTPPV